MTTPVGRGDRPSTDAGLRAVTVWRPDHGAGSDLLAVEAPLEIRLGGEPLVMLMRTPGEDLDLAAGFLLSEGLVAEPDDLTHLARCADPNRPHRENVVLAQRAPGAPRPAARAFTSSSACGVCGKRQIDDLLARAPALTERVILTGAQIASLTAALSAAQPRFAATGGLHGAAVMRPTGEVHVVREDVGRHNAVDKVFGACWRAGDWPLEGRVLVVSSRAGYEIVQKALVARVGAVVALGAATSLAHDLAVEAGLALYSFARGARFNAHQAG